jgi:hypothetical protein
MGSAKRMMERHETMCRAAVEIALEARVLRYCEYHEDCVFEGPIDIESAYKLGNYKFTVGSMAGVFDTRREMTDCVKKVVEDHPADECPRCAELREE